MPGMAEMMASMQGMGMGMPGMPGADGQSMPNPPPFPPDFMKNADFMKEFMNEEGTDQSTEGTATPTESRSKAEIPSPQSAGTGGRSRGGKKAGQNESD